MMRRSLSIDDEDYWYHEYADHHPTWAWLVAEGLDPGTLVAGVELVGEGLVRLELIALPGQEPQVVDDELVRTTVDMPVSSLPPFVHYRELSWSEATRPAT